MQNHVYTFHADAGHGWLQVPIRFLVDLGIVKKISRYSYTDGENAYLEEDCDLTVFWEAFKEKFEQEPFTREKYSAQSFVRRLSRFGA